MQRWLAPLAQMRSPLAQLWLRYSRTSAEMHSKRAQKVKGKRDNSKGSKTDPSPRRRGRRWHWWGKSFPQCRCRRTRCRCRRLPPRAALLARPRRSSGKVSASPSQQLWCRAGSGQAGSRRRSTTLRRTVKRVSKVAGRNVIAQKLKKGVAGLGSWCSTQSTWNNPAHSRKPAGSC